MSELEEMTTRDLFELADGMRHWWNDDNPDEEQLFEYDKLRFAGQTLAHDKYIFSLERCVAELYQRFERGEIIGGQLG